MPAYGVGVEHHTALERFSSKVLVHESRVSFIYVCIHSRYVLCWFGSFLLACLKIAYLMCFHPGVLR